MTSDLINFFIDSGDRAGLPVPHDRSGVGNDWQIKVNKRPTLQNIRTWLELIEQNPKWSTRLLIS
jgi:pyruvate, orthophosphate dikinase